LINKFGSEKAEEVVKNSIANIDDFKKMMEHYYEVTGQIIKTDGKFVPDHQHNSTEKEDLTGKHYHNDTDIFSSKKFNKRKQSNFSSKQKKAIGETILDDIKKVGSYIGEEVKKIGEEIGEKLHIIPEAVAQVKNITLSYLENKKEDTEYSKNTGKHKHRNPKDDLLGIHIHDLDTKKEEVDKSKKAKKHKHKNPKDDLLGIHIHDLFTKKEEEVDKSTDSKKHRHQNPKDVLLGVHIHDED